MHCLGTYEAKTITDGVSIQIKDLGGTKLKGMVNGSRMKLYRDNRPTKSS
jgi:hypothetical protein